MKIRPLGAELFHANGQTTLIVAFRNSQMRNKTYLGEGNCECGLKIPKTGTSGEFL